MKKSLLLTLICFTLINTIFLLLSFFKDTKAPKVAVVQMEKLVYEYYGMKEASEYYGEQLIEWNLQSDSLQEEMQKLWKLIQEDSINHKKNALAVKKAELQQQQEAYLAFTNKMNQVAQEQDQNMTLGILNQIRQHMKDYAQERGYDLILANTQLENIAYAAAPIDVTIDLLAYANKKYEYGN